MIPYGRHQITPDDVAAVVDVLENRFLTQGDQVPLFEQDLCEYTGACHAIAANSGTSALHIACLALDIGPGDVVWTTPISFVASANCARYCGADVDFVDIDPETHNISLQALSDRLDAARRQHRLPKAIVVVHYAGLSCDMQSIRSLTEADGIHLIEDASHALGGYYQERPVGCSDWSEATIFSFHPVKSITSAEGGALLTRDPELARKARLFASHGITRDASAMEDNPDGPWYYQQVALGYNYRLSELHAALGRSQLVRATTLIEARATKAGRYCEALKHLPLRLPGGTEFARSAWHLYPVELMEHDRSRIYEVMVSRGIGVNVHYIPIHLQPYYRRLGFSPGDFPVAESFYQKMLTLPLFPELSADEQEQVIHALTESLN